LLQFSGKTLAWMVQMPSVSGETAIACSRTVPRPSPLASAATFAGSPWFVVKRIPCLES
jgi:hypothetical protein